MSIILFIEVLRAKDGGVMLFRDRMSPSVFHFIAGSLLVLAVVSSYQCSCVHSVTVAFLFVHFPPPSVYLLLMLSGSPGVADTACVIGGIWL